MAHDASAFATLGLKPGADAVAIERAYKQLIKQHHPDREGGDSERAAELNRAYRELRAGVGQKDGLVFHDDEPLGKGGSRWVRAAVVLLIALGALLATTGPVTAFMQQLAQPAPRLARQASKPVATDVMDQPL